MRCNGRDDLDTNKAYSQLCLGHYVAFLSLVYVRLLQLGLMVRVKMHHKPDIYDYKFP